MGKDQFSRKTAQIAFRLKLNRVLRIFTASLTILSGLYLIVFIISRILNILPWKLDLYTAFIPCCAALSVSLAASGKVKKREAAHAMDGSAGTKDLFLTNLMLEGAAGDFQDLVRLQAEEKAGSITAKKAVPLFWGRPVCVFLVSLLVLIPAVLFLPQFDPFEKDEERKKQQEWEEKLQRKREASLKLLTALKKLDTAKRNTEPVEAALKRLKITLKNVEKGNKTGNLKKLGLDQKELGELWRKSNSEQLKGEGRSGEQKQRFGTLDPDKAAEWQKKLSKGDSSGMKQEMDLMKRTLSRLKKETDPQKQEDLKKQLKQQMKEMEEFFSEKMNSSEVSSALKQAMENLSMSDMQGLSREALEALKDSLDLTQAQIDKFAQDMRDLEDLEQALLTLQKARQLNQADMLSGGEGGEGAEEGMSLEEYEKMYDDMLAGKGEGNGQGEGMKGPGTGKGGQAGEDDSKKSEFTPEQSKSALTAGKILLQMKTRGLGDKGEMNKEYQEMVEEVRQGVSEAVIREEVPPDYHESIKGYFDTLKKEENDTAGE